MVEPSRVARLRGAGKRRRIEGAPGNNQHRVAGPDGVERQLPFAETIAAAGAFRIVSAAHGILLDEREIEAHHFDAAAPVARADRAEVFTPRGGHLDETDFCHRRLGRVGAEPEAAHDRHHEGRDERGDDLVTSVGAEPIEDAVRDGEERTLFGIGGDAAIVRIVIGHFGYLGDSC